MYLGPWGSGKTYLAELINQNLLLYNNQKIYNNNSNQHNHHNHNNCTTSTDPINHTDSDSDSTFPTVPDNYYVPLTFNAWSYSGSDNLWSSLIKQLYECIDQEYGEWNVKWYRIQKRKLLVDIIWTMIQVISLIILLYTGISLTTNSSSDALNQFIQLNPINNSHLTLLSSISFIISLYKGWGWKW